jgi:hypothetical protein
MGVRSLEGLGGRLMGNVAATEADTMRTELHGGHMHEPE